MRFVVTDVAPWGPSFWRAHESAARFVAAGLLDFAVFDAAAGGPLRLAVSGEELAPGSLRAPVVALSAALSGGMMVGVDATAGFWRDHVVPRLPKTQ